MATSSQFRTFQTPQNYEDALARHAQWMRWTQGITCACMDDRTMQPNPQCSVCRGRGRIYRTPDRFRAVAERARHDNLGRIYPLHTPVIVGTAEAFRKDVAISLDPLQPPDGSYIQLATPYPKAYEVVTINYEFTPEISITGEDSEVYGTNVLRVVAPRFSTRGKSFEGSIEDVTRVYNVDRDETYSVESAVKEFIYLTGMGTWVAGDTLEVDYTYVEPFGFLLVGVTGRLRYEQPYVLEEADAILVTPYWAQVGPDDLLTALAQEQIGRAILNPRAAAGNDVVTSYYDLSRLLRVIDKDGTDYTVGTGNNVELYGRNELKWNITKPIVPYTAQFTYHPTYTALANLHSLRNAENKAFVNRVSVRQFDHVHEKVRY